MFSISKKLSFALAMLLMTAEEAQAGPYKKKYDYIFNGADWPYDKDSECWKTNQSPIDLRTDVHSEPFPKGDGTEWSGSYINLVKATVLNMGKVI